MHISYSSKCLCVYVCALQWNHMCWMWASFCWAGRAPIEPFNEITVICTRWVLTSVSSECVALARLCGLLCVWAWVCVFMSCLYCSVYSLQACLYRQNAPADRRQSRQDYKCIASCCALLQTLWLTVATKQASVWTCVFTGTPNISLFVIKGPTLC